MIKLKYATGNQSKFDSAKMIFDKVGIELEQCKIDKLIEIQGDNNEEIAIHSSKIAHDKLGGLVLKNDGGLFIPKLNNFPGVYAGFVEDTIGEEGILKLLDGYISDEDRYAYFIEVLALTEDDGTVKTFTCKTEGKIALNSRGNFGWGYDKIFIPKGEDDTLACFEDEKRFSFWSQEGYISLANYLLAKYGEK